MIMSGKKQQEEIYGFVVLHYMAYEMSIECIDKLLKQFGRKNIHIVVVDNASGNGSGERIKNNYKGISEITVILNEKNEGFARGNNIGFRHLKENYNCKFITVMNNDVLIEQDDFLEKISFVYQQTKFAVLGPDIFCPAINSHQNPAHEKGFTYKEIRDLYDVKLQRCKHPLYSYYKMKFSELKKYFTKKTVNLTNNDDYRSMKQDVVLHGACYILSKDFIDSRNSCFNPSTFLYMEEDILHYECQQEGLIMLYSPVVKVIHLEDISTNISKKSEYEKFKFKEHEMKNSLKVMLRIMEQGKLF